MWCLSGVVMMYVSYPDLAEEARFRHLAPIDWSGCCKLSDEALKDDALVKEAQIEMLANRAVLRLRTATESRLLELSTGRVIDRVSPEEAAEVAQTYMDGLAPTALQSLGFKDHDQWTVSGSLGVLPLGHRALYRGQAVHSPARRALVALSGIQSLASSCWSRIRSIGSDLDIERVSFDESVGMARGRGRSDGVQPVARQAGNRGSGSQRRPRVFRAYASTRCRIDQNRAPRGATVFRRHHRGGRTPTIQRKRGANTAE
jgi:hypothetical protein